MICTLVGHMNKYYNYHKKRQNGQDPIANLFKILFAPFKQLFSKNKLDYNKINKKWQEIDGLLKEGSQSGLKTAVLESDKLFDYYLKSLGFRGETMGERLKSARNRLESQNQGVWQAHILRNKIVHETDCQIGISQAKTAIEGFKKGIRKLN
jgi:hypothetical protein